MEPEVAHLICAYCGEDFYDTDDADPFCSPACERAYADAAGEGEPPF